MATPGSTSTAGNPELLKAINTLTKAIDGISKSMHTDTSAATRRARGAQPGNNNARKDPNAISKREADAQYNRNKRLAQNQEKSIATLVSELHGFGKELNRLSGETRKSQREHGLLLKKQNEHAKTLLEHDKLSKRYQDRFISSMENVLKSSKSLNGNKLKATTTGGRVKEVLGIQDKVKNVLTTASRIRSKNGNGSMDEKDIGTLMRSMSSAGVSADGMDEKQYQDKLAKLNAKHDKEISSRRKAIRKHVGSDRPDDGRLQKLNEALKAAQASAKNEKAQFLADTVGKVNKGISGVEAFNRSMNTSTIANLGLSSASEFAHKTIEKLGGSGITASSGLMMMMKAAGEYYVFMKTLSSKQMGGAAWEISKDALSMSASVDATATYLKTLAFQVSQLGFGKVINIVNNNRESFNKLGLFGDDAVKAAAEFTGNLMLMGVHPKDEKKFNKAMGQYAARVNEMAQLTGASVSDLIAQDRAILNSTETQKMMMRLGAQERSQKTQELLLEKQRLTYLIGSNEEAAKFIQTLQKVNGEKADKRLENSIKMQQLMSTVGLGVDAGRMAGVMMKREDQLTKSDREFMQKTYMELGKRTNQIQGQGGFASEYLIDQFVGAQGTSVQNAIQAGADAALSKDQKGSVDAKASEAQNVKDTYQIGATNATLRQMGAIYESFITNPIVKLLTGIVGGIGVIAVAMIGKDKIKGAAEKGLGKIIDKFSGNASGKIAAEGVKDAVGGATKAAGTTVAKEAGNTALKTGAGAVGGVVAKEAGESAVKAGGKGLGKSILKKIPGIGLLAGIGFGVSRLMSGDYLGAAGEVASGAASTVPGLGTAASVAIDAGLAARDIKSAIDGAPIEGADNASSASKIKMPNGVSPQDTINTQSSDTSSKKDPVQDLIASVRSGDELEQSKMDEMIKLLKTLIETVKPENNGLLQAIRSGSATGVSFNDLHDKRTLLSTK